MTIEQRLTEEVFGIIEELISNGTPGVRPGDVSSKLRERGAPLGTWQIRAEFTQLEEQGRIACNAETGAWHLVESASLQDAG